MSTAHPPTAQAPMRTILSHVIVPILMGLIMCAAYLGGFHKPSPHHVPVAVVGQAQQAGPLAAKVQDAFGDEADVRTIATPEQATDQLKHLKISAAYVPGDGKAELLTAGGASDTTKSVVEKMFRPVAEKQHDALTVKDVAPLTEDDPAGQNGFFFLVALTVAAYATSIAIGAHSPSASPSPPAPPSSSRRSNSRSRRGVTTCSVGTCSQRGRCRCSTQPAC